LMLAGASCARRKAPAIVPEAADTMAAGAIARDRPQRLVLPLAPLGTGQMAIEAVAPARATLDLPPPPAEISEPPADSSSSHANAEAPQLHPPIPRGSPTLPRGGRGGHVTLDVRVDEAGEVSDVELVETDADSLTVLAA